MPASYEIDPQTGCHNWLGELNDSGYAIIWVQTKKVRVARLLLRVHQGDPPPGYMALHTCDNRRCINMEHAYWGTHLDNSMDALRRNRYNGMPGEKHGSSKLKVDDVYFIRASTARGVDLAAMFDVTPALISNIRNRKLWKHLPEK